jgi:hypothetical protein
VTCGPTVSTPPLVKAMREARSTGLWLYRWSRGETPSVLSIASHIFGVAGVIGLVKNEWKNGLNNRPPDSFATGWYTKSAEAQAAALASCCPQGNPPQPPPPVGPPNGAPPPFDPKSASLTGARIAADALRKAGFPETQIPMGVAVAKYETGWRNIPGPTVNGSTMRGMWQINWNVHPEVHGMGDWRDPYANARMAYTIWRKAGNWNDWSTHTAASRTAASFASLSQSGPAAPKTPGTPTGPGVTIPAPSPNPVGCTPPSGSPNPAKPAGPPVLSISGGPAPAVFNQMGNPRTADQAVAWMSHLGHAPVGQCAHYVAAAYGWPNAGAPTAVALWQSIPSSLKHVGADGSPPKGALIFWRTGNPAWHVALSAGQRRVVSTDVDSHGWHVGAVGVVPISVINGWGPMQGWAAPDFPVHSHPNGATV